MPIYHNFLFEFFEPRHKVVEWTRMTEINSNSEGNDVYNIELVGYGCKIAKGDSIIFSPNIDRSICPDELNSESDLSDTYCIEIIDVKSIIYNWKNQCDQFVCQGQSFPFTANDWLDLLFNEIPLEQYYLVMPDGNPIIDQNVDVKHSSIALDEIFDDKMQRINKIRKAIESKTGFV